MKSSEPVQHDWNKQYFAQKETKAYTLLEDGVPNWFFRLFLDLANYHLNYTTTYQSISMEKALQALQITVNILKKLKNKQILKHFNVTHIVHYTLFIFFFSEIKNPILICSEEGVSLRLVCHLLVKKRRCIQFIASLPPLVPDQVLDTVVRN